MQRELAQRMASPFFTIGHSNRSSEAFAGLLSGAAIALIADVRTVPRSRTNPQFNAEALAETLPQVQIGYERFVALGGLRQKQRQVPPDINGWWTNESFHNYADYALSAEFRAGLDALIAAGRRRRCAIMCSEAVWWRCHRRIIADHLLARGETVFHIMGEGRLEPATLTVGAVVRPDGTIVYPAA
jgi:uncharacterized protein (DUF488 family)